MNIELNKYALYAVIAICVLVLLISLIICVIKMYRTKREFDSINIYNEKSTQNNTASYNDMKKQYNQNINDCGIPKPKINMKTIRKILQIFKILK